MKKSIKKVMQYVVVFIVTLFICVFLEVLVALIPQEVIQRNMEETANFYYARQLRVRLIPELESTTLDYYADCILFNIMFHINSETPIKAIMSDEFFNGEFLGANIDLMESVFQNTGANTEYSRYWHGSMVWLRPLLCIIDVGGIYVLYAILILGGALGIIVWLLQKKQWKLVISFMIAFIMGGGPITTACIEYGNIMILMLAMIPLFISQASKDTRYLYMTCIVCGMMTNYVDFLTAELLTITMPLTFLILMNQDKTKTEKQCKRIITAIFVWGISYIGMFLAKWILVTMYSDIHNVLDNMSRTQEHIQGSPVTAMIKNMQMLFGVGETGAVLGDFIWLAAWISCMLLILFYGIRSRKLGTGIGLFLLAILPYVRYVCIRSHSTIHSFFTYRSQMSTVMIVTFIVLDMIQKKMKNRG